MEELYGSVRFGELDSFGDFNLMLIAKKIGLPNIQTDKITVQGRNGELDLIRYLNDDNPVYTNRELVFTFVSSPTLDSNLSDFIGHVHGRYLELVVNRDEEYHWRGRCTIDDVDEQRGYSLVTLRVDAEPFRYGTQRKKVFSLLAQEERYVTFDSGDKRVVPQITVDGLVCVGKTDTGENTLEPGSYQLASLAFSRGRNVVVFQADNTEVQVEVTWEFACL